jgi:hypothetical protein
MLSDDMKIFLCISCNLEMTKMVYTDPYLLCLYLQLIFARSYNYLFIKFKLENVLLDIGDKCLAKRTQIFF